jgi:hypothetical protein
MGQFPLIHLESDSKIQIFGSAVILTTTGSVGYAQRLHHHIDAAVKGSGPPPEKWSDLKYVF